MIWALVIIIGIVLDQSTKMLIKTSMELFQSIPVIKGFFDIYYVTNSGGAWSILADHTWLLTLISCIMVGAMTWYMIKNRDKFVKFSLSLIISGAVGNLIDRISNGKVVDFLAFDIFGYDFPTFNVADILVVVGTFALCAYIIFFYDKAETRRKEKNATEVSALEEQE